MFDSLGKSTLVRLFFRFPSSGLPSTVRIQGILLSACVLLAIPGVGHAAGARPAAAKPKPPAETVLYVATDGDDRWSGKLADPEHGDFSLWPDSPAFMLGFKLIDVNPAGPRG